MKTLKELESKVQVIVKAHRKLGDMIMKVDDDEYYVEGQKDKKYSIKRVAGDWGCDCPSFKYKWGVDDVDGSCKHIRALKWMIESGEHIRSVYDVMKEEMEND